MELRRLRRHVINRGGLSEVWLVYEDEHAGNSSGSSGGSSPRLVRAFWSRADAIQWASAQESTGTGRYHVYHVPIEERWVVENSLRAAHHVSINGAPPRPSVAVTPGAIAHAFK